MNNHNFLLNNSLRITKTYMRHIKYNDKIKFSNSQTDTTHKLTNFIIKRQYPRSSSFNIFWIVKSYIH